METNAIENTCVQKDEPKKEKVRETETNRYHVIHWYHRPLRPGEKAYMERYLNSFRKK
jgi:hypothetical protein